ncbi:hypothetical protein BJ138DRAFT_1168421 [Hygrophoropsis aurantiaca]|uniref:Uncharacterized protein n=1 Tax=Hygrophoropsis aurantiaca TaxID=72124 RepID=A0ACB7ZRA3_9AGAM|nr:hypothetical protein BJ138DRAFT_1168421 [Hygrophoropsis aurantiaca]
MLGPKNTPLFIIVVSFLSILACSATERRWCELPYVGIHSYRFDVYDGVGCHKEEHSETFVGTFKMWPLLPCICHNLSPSMHGKVRSLALNQGLIPLSRTEARSEKNCNGVALATSGEGNWIVNDDGAEFKDVRSFFVCSLRVLPVF